MEKLLDQADALVLTSGVEMEPDRPDFEIPEEYSNFTEPHNLLELKDNPNKGRGWFAKASIPAGTLLLVAKPLTMALDWEWDPDMDDPITGNNNMDEDEDIENMAEPVESQINELLVLQILQDIATNPSIWNDQVQNLYPRDSVDIQASPVWVSKDDDIFTQFEKLIRECENNPALSGKTQEISKRLPLIVRYNVLSIETCPEMLSYPGTTGHCGLQGVGLYYLPSFFNHDARPNVSRCAIGDVMWFIANQDIAAGAEACISYLEHDILCESAYRRNLVLTLDFEEKEDDHLSEAGGPDMPVVDSDIQNELMAMSPFERLDSIEQLMAQASGEVQPESDLPSENEMNEEDTAWFQCDVQNLRILKAITLDAMGQSQHALPIWNQCIEFTEQKMPPNDESSTVMRVQGALCALHVKDEAQAKQHAQVALARHNLMFGGGVRRFRRRFQKEFCLALRPSSSDSRTDGISPHDHLWPLGMS